MKPSRAFFASVFVLFLLVAIPVSATDPLRQGVQSALKFPLVVSRGAVQFVLDLVHFRRNAGENVQLRRKMAESRNERFRVEEILLENERLTRLLEIRKAVPASVRRSVVARVLGRSISSWSRTFLLDKGSRDGLRPNMLVLSELSLIGRVAETGPSVSKALAINDPNSKIAVLVQRTRQEGVLFGTLSGECRVKYLSLDREVKPGDVVETAGFGSFPKSVMVGKVEKVWKEPGQVYQVAVLRPFADLSRLEEVMCVE